MESGARAEDAEFVHRTRTSIGRKRCLFSCFDVGASYIVRGAMFAAQSQGPKN